MLGQKLQAVMSGSEAALYKTVAKVLEIPVEFIPKDLVLQVVVKRILLD